MHHTSSLQTSDADQTLLLRTPAIHKKTPCTIHKHEEVQKGVKTEKNSTFKHFLKKKKNSDILEPADNFNLTEQLSHLRMHYKYFE